MASLSFIVGIIGNIVSILVFCSPIGTFWQVVKKKSTEGYQGLPYISTLLSTSLWTFYGLLKWPEGLLVVTVNGAGAILQFIYVALFLIFAPMDTKVKSIKLVAVLNVGFPASVVALALFAIHGSPRLAFVGVLCAALTIGMYASPLSVMTTVIQTKSVEYMPFFLSFFLFLNAGVWTGYSILVRDYYIGVPNAIGFVLGSGQLILYAVYREKPSMTEQEDGSVGLVNAVIEMQSFQDEEGGDDPKAGNLIKFKSLPRPTVTRRPSGLPGVMKTLSLGPYDLQYTNPLDLKGVGNWTAID
uniref:Bidirectional sugar transporter SWEET n=1 Tax=Nepenthes sp. MF-2019 TaxID=2518353 RepID=A0A482JQ50_9CARY|nr:SWEET16-like bidirectional sugar transporter [Nepenthes sp. MF-2019]